MNKDTYLGYLAQYDNLENNEKEINISKIISNGIILGIIFQFLADILVSIFFNEENVLLNDITISNLPKYYAAAGSGGLLGYASIFADRYAITPLSTTTYVYINNYMDSLMNETELDIDTTDLIFDIIATEILLYVFRPSIHIDYINHYNLLHHLDKPKIKAKENPSQAIFFTVITTTFLAGKRNFIKK